MDTFHCRVILLAVVAQWKQNPSPTKLFMRRFVVTESWFLEQDSAIIFKRRQTSLQLRSPKHDGVDSVKSQKTYSFAWSDASAMAPFSPVSHECDPRSELPHRKRSRLLIRWLYTTQAWDPDLKEGGVSFPALFHRLWTQPEREPSLSGQPTSSSSQSGFLYPAAEWQEECREKKKTNKSGQSIPLRNRIFAGASRAHDVAPWTLREKGGGDFQLHLCLSGAVFFSFFFFFLFASQLFSPSQLLASSAVNLAVYNLSSVHLLSWEMTHRKLRVYFQNEICRILTVINLRIALMCLLPVFWRPFIHNLMLLRPCISQP